MTRPRRPFGAQLPGRLPATMLKVLAAEMSDPQRLRRGKQYARDGAVVDIVVEPGVVTCEVQGSRPTPYIATIEVRPGDGMPLRRDMHTTCTCPDLAGDAGGTWSTGPAAGETCKHVIAAMFTFSDELLLEPALLDTWRGRRHRPPSAEPPPSRPDDALRSTRSATVPRRRGRTAAAHRTGEGRAPSAERDPLAPLLRRRATLPDLPLLSPTDDPPPPRAELAALLGDALAHLRSDED